MQTINRRQFIKLGSIFAGSVVISTSLSGCALTIKPSAAKFSHGVASGDPTKNSVILWTRAVPKNSDNSEPVTVSWQIADNPAFKNVVRDGQATTTAGRDYTLKIDVQELTPNTTYYYRFLATGSTSELGKTKTLPVDNVSKVTFAVFSCSNYPAGYFTAYNLAAQMQNIDVVLHLGDYIYEYAADGYATGQAEQIGRSPDANNLTEVITLADYRHRYALYRTDTGLQAIHAAAPFIAVWDDHEITNNTYKTGAQNHNEGEGDFFERRANAIQAYYEWLPIRPPFGESSAQIYRRFDFGNLLSLHMLDTRVIGRDKQLSYKDFTDDQGVMNVDAFTNALTSADRTLLGSAQLSWLEQQIADSTATWQLLGQQVLMGKMLFPAEVMANRDLSKTASMFAQVADIRRRQQMGEMLSDSEQARLNKVMGYNLDAWDGYPNEREALYRFIKQQEKKLVVVAGDTHNAWCNRLTMQNGETIGFEYATPGVSSPGMEKYLSLDDNQAKRLADDVKVLIADVEYCNLHQRGFLTLDITHDDIQATWLYVATVLTPSSEIANSVVIQQSSL
jgi:alkaline phosphatase D